MPILLVSAAYSVRPGSLDIDSSPPRRWMYLGRSYSRMLQWEGRFPPSAHRIAIGERLQTIAWDLRRPFLALIAQLGRKYNSLDWWVSRLSERNTTISPLFLNCCYLKLVSEVLATQDGDLCIVGESLALLECIGALARCRGFEVRWCKPGWKRSVLPRPLRRLVYALWHYGWEFPRFWGAFLRWGQKQLNEARGTRLLGRPLPSDPNRPRALFHTFIDESCFGSEGQFRERYWGCLPSWLEKQGYDVVFTSSFFNIQRSKEEALSWLRQSDVRFLVPEDYFRFSDYLRAIPTTVRQLAMPQGAVSLDSLDITLLVEEEKAQQSTVSHSLLCRMYYELAHRLSESHFRVDYVFHTFENHIWEKALVLGFRRFFPTAKIVGFQHTTFFPLYLCNLVPQSEIGVAPLADRIVCNGPFFKDLLVSEGLPTERVAVGCALRFDHLQGLSEKNIQAERIEKNILVTLSLEPDAVDELIHKVVRAFKDAPEFPVLIKPHPLMPPARLRAAIDTQEMPSHFHFVEGPIRDWLLRADLLISTGSATAYEALAMGIPALRVGRETDLDFDPLMWLLEYRQACRAPEEIRHRAVELLNLDDTERQRLREFGQEFLQKSFAPVKEEGLRRFMP